MSLVFVYNADSGILNALKDAAHKLFSPGSYPCSLCALTYGPVSKRRKWSRYCRRDHRAMKFLHKDEFEAGFRQRFEYPVVLQQIESAGNEPSLSVLISSRQLDSMGDLDELIYALSENH